LNNVEYGGAMVVLHKFCRIAWSSYKSAQNGYGQKHYNTKNTIVTEWCRPMREIQCDCESEISILHI